MAQYSIYRPWVGGQRGGSLDQLRQEMDTLFNRFGTAASTTTGGHGAYPAVNLYETADAYVLSAELPGMTTEDISVSLEGSTVTISGERKIEHKAEDVSVHRAERPSGSFRRAFELPLEVDGDKAEAAHRNGVLMVRLPKSEEHRSRQISIQGGQS